MPISIVDDQEQKLLFPEKSNESLATLLWTSGKLSAPALCSGLGRCGNCRVRFLSTPPLPVDHDFAVLGKAAVESGWRLACQHQATPDIRLFLPTQEKTQKTHWKKPLPSFDPNTTRLALDLGTTSLQWRFEADACNISDNISACSKKTVVLLGEGEALNPQMGAGSEVISRLAFASRNDGSAKLQDLILQFLKSLLTEATEKVGNIAELCLAGNTAMTALLLQADISGLTAAPYRLPLQGGKTVHLAYLPPVWIPPQIAPFVGGDISAGMAYLLREKTHFPFLFADLGTNGEFVLALNEHEALATSVPLGPSLEGIGLSLGSVARQGVAYAFTITPQGLSPLFIADPQEKRCPSDKKFDSKSLDFLDEKRKICGTGYLSLLDCLLRIGVLESSGRLASAPSPLASRFLKNNVEYQEVGGWRLNLPQGLFLTGEDVEEILKVKAAFAIARKTLLAQAGVSLSDLACVELGGSLGLHAPIDVLEHLGFLTLGMGKRTHAVGNTSLSGASLLLSHPELRESLCTWSQHCQVIDLTSQPEFAQEYMRELRFGN